MAKALRWMLNLSSPFYIKPRLDRELIRWGMAFWRSAKKSTMQKAIPPLNKILQLSRELMNAMRDDLGNHFRMEEKGCFMFYKTIRGERQETKLLAETKLPGIAGRIYDGREIQEMEPRIRVDVLGGVLYPVDSHLHPADFMEVLKTRLVAGGVKFQLHTTVTGFRISGRSVAAVRTDQGVSIAGN